MTEVRATSCTAASTQRGRIDGRMASRGGHHRPDLANKGNANQRRQQVMQDCVWAEQRTMGVFVGVLNDNEEEQDGDDPSGNHHDDRGVRGQIGGPGSMCPRRVLGFVTDLRPTRSSYRIWCRNGENAPPQLNNRLGLLTVVSIEYPFHF